MSRFVAELVVTLKDGSGCVSEYYNQVEMAEFTRSSMLERVRLGEAIVVYDPERLEIPASAVDSVQVRTKRLAGVS